MVVLVVEERCHFDVKTALDWEDKSPAATATAGDGVGFLAVFPIRGPSRCALPRDKNSAPKFR